MGRLDCLFNNAGAGGVTGGVESISAEGFDATMALLVRAVLLGMKHAAPIMRRQRSGSIISTASVAGLRGGWGPRLQRGQGGGDPAHAVHRDGAGGERDPGITAGRPWSENKAMGTQIRDVLGVLRRR